MGRSCLASASWTGELAAPTVDNCILLSSNALGFAGKLLIFLLHPLDMIRNHMQLRKSFSLSFYFSRFVLGFE